MLDFFKIFTSLFCVVVLFTPNLSAQIEQHLQVDADTLRYDIACGDTECHEVLLTNISSRPLQILSLTQTQTPFSVSPPFATPTTIPVGGSTRINFCFSPTISGLTNSQNNLILTVDTGDAANLARVNLVLFGVSRSASVDFDPPSVSFGGIVVGKQVCQDITITNTGNQAIDLTTLRPFGAPYTITPPLSGTLPPGAAITVELCFSPTVEGLFPDTLEAANGNCRSPARLVVSAAGMLLAPALGPILQVSPPFLDFDTTRCGTTKCRDVTIRNVGSSVTTITSPDQIFSPFSGTFPPTPLVLQPDSAITIRVCYSPPDGPRVDTQLVGFIADSRYPLTIATVFDISGSMDDDLSGNIKKIEAANAAGRVFLDSLVHDTLRGLVDTAAVYEFGSLRAFNRNAGYTPDQAVLVNAIPTIANGGSTCIWDALLRIIAELRQENLPGRRVIVVLTDGRDSDCTFDLPRDVIDAANAAGIRIYAIGVGVPGDVDDAALTSIATGTSGRYFFAPDADSLVQIYKQISEDLSKGATGYIVLRGEGAAPVLELTPPTIMYDSVRVDSARCRTVTITNVGNAPYPGGPLNGMEAPFTTRTPIAPPLRPGESVDIEICFSPRGLRGHRDTLFLSYPSCPFDTLTAELDGVGYDSIVVEMRGVFTGRPRSVIEIPVWLLDPIPDSYEVDSLRIRVTYNKTMLFPSDSIIATTGTASEGMTPTVESLTYVGDTAVMDVLFSDGRLRSDAPTIELARIRFTVLLGNAMETPIKVVAATLADGNPKVGRKNPAVFQIDSICYLPERLLDASARYNGLITSVSKHTSRLIVQYSATLEHGVEPVTAHVALYDRTGRIVSVMDQRTIAASGSFEAEADGSGLAAGSYFVVLTINGAKRIVQGVVVW